MKYITFSYDDGITQDKRLIEIFNKYNLKCTFNINSGLFGKEEYIEREGKTVSLIRNKKEDIKHIYEGHEVAAHGVTHGRLDEMSDEEIIRETEGDRLALSELVGYEVKGMAYACGFYDSRVIDVLKNKTGVKYARVVESSHGFKMPEEPFALHGTLYHHKDWNDLFETGERFLNQSFDNDALLYIWGHGFEFDIYPERWGEFEEFCRFISGKKDIVYGTNSEVLASVIK